MSLKVLTERYSRNAMKMPAHDFLQSGNQDLVINHDNLVKLNWSDENQQLPELFLADA